MTHTPRRALLWLGLALLPAALLALLPGAIDLSPLEILKALGNAGADTTSVLVVRELRLPRVLLALLVGSGLGASGAALQALLRNPLADPGVLGVSSSAGLGAVVAFYTGLSRLHPLALPLGGLLGALPVTLLLLALARRGAGVLSLTLAGVALGSLAGALTSLLLSLVPNPYAAYEIVFWLMGSLADRTLQHVLLVTPFWAAGLLLLLRAARGLDVLVLGEAVAATLGVEVRTLRTGVVAGTALCVGPGVAVAGFIGFVGLLVPHALRPWLGHRPALLVPASALAGALLTVVADVACRLLPLNGELKLGVLTALLGAPGLLWLLWRHRGTFA